MEKDKIIKDAQYRKGLSIAFFNATNAAVEFAKINGLAGIIDPKKFIAEWRDWFLEEHKTYYANVIANVGGNYDPKVALDKLSASKTLDELRNVWRYLSEDERRDPRILETKDKMKLALSKPKKTANEKA